MIKKALFIVLIAVLVLTGCAPLAPRGAAALTVAMVTPTPSGGTHSASLSNQTAGVGPDTYPEGVNPLTGLEVEDPENLDLPPALVSITNFPISARPQAGLSYSPIVFELYIGQGDSRYLAMFYGDYPDLAASAGGSVNTTNNSDPSVGPVRSGRLPYEPLRAQYNGFLVMASAYKTIAANLSEFTNIFASDSGDINSAMLDVTKLEDIAKANQKKLDTSSLSGNLFDAAVPKGGVDGTSLWIPWSYYNQVIWRYDEESGAYNRYQDKADGVTFELMTDRLNGEPLTYENVVVLFANHHVYAETVIDIELQYMKKMPALVFRDGKMYQVYWTTANGDYEKKTGKLRPIRFIDAQGNPFPMKPGQTWVEMVPYGAAYNETVDSENYYLKKRTVEAGSGNWMVHFYVPAIEEMPAWLKNK